MRELYVEALGGPGHALDDEQLSNSLTSTLAAKPKGAGWWVFAYGSLLWNPLFPFVEARAGVLRGLHRRFCLYSMASRGTPGRAGPGAGPRPRRRVHGVVYRLPAPVAIDELHLLWRREMVVGLVPAEMGRRAVRRAPPDGAGVHRAPRPPAVHGQALARRRGAGDRVPRARSARRSTISSARASRSSRTASSIRTSRGSRRGSSRCAAERSGGRAAGAAAAAAADTRALRSRHAARRRR